VLKQRILTALILAVVFVGCILFTETRWVGLLFTIVLFAATRELLALTLRLPLPVTLLVSAAFSLLFWWSLSIANPVLVQWQALAGLVLWLLIAVGLVFYRHHGNWPLLARVLMLGLGLDLLWICVHCLVYLHYVYGGWTLLFMFTLVWMVDIGAYFCGRRFGRRKLAQVISPGKTWEGVFGGLAATLAWMLLVYALVDGVQLGLAAYLAIGLATVSVSIVGDLFESVLKREAGVKDSGALLPGHGGVLDRIDSVIAAAPVFVTGLMLVGSA
jgi:phosphatidate cytidylyltransferase